MSPSPLLRFRSFATSPTANRSPNALRRDPSRATNKAAARAGAEVGATRTSATTPRTAATGAATAAAIVAAGLATNPAAKEIAKLAALNLRRTQKMHKAPGANAPLPTPGTTRAVAAHDVAVPAVVAARAPAQAAVHHEVAGVAAEAVVAVRGLTRIAVEADRARPTPSSSPNGNIFLARRSDFPV